MQTRPKSETENRSDNVNSHRIFDKRNFHNKMETGNCLTQRTGSSSLYFIAGPKYREKIFPLREKCFCEDNHYGTSERSVPSG